MTTIYMKQWREPVKQVSKFSLTPQITVKSKSCSFFGEIYTPQGVKPDTKKAEAFKRIQALFIN